MSVDIRRESPELLKIASAFHRDFINKRRAREFTSWPKFPLLYTAYDYDGLYIALYLCSIGYGCATLVKTFVL